MCFKLLEFHRKLEITIWWLLSQVIVPSSRSRMGKLLERTVFIFCSLTSVYSDLTHFWNWGCSIHCMGVIRWVYLSLSLFSWCQISATELFLLVLCIISRAAESILVMQASKYMCRIDSQKQNRISGSKGMYVYVLTGYSSSPKGSAFLFF